MNRYEPYYLLSCSIQIMKENEHLKTENFNYLKQISKLEQINNYIVAAQQNRDKLIEQLTKENKNLNNTLHNQQNILKTLNKNDLNANMNKSVHWITPIKSIEKQDTLPYLGSMSNIQKRASLKISFAMLIPIKNIFQFLAHMKKNSPLFNMEGSVIKEDIYNKNANNFSGE